MAGKSKSAEDKAAKKTISLPKEMYDRAMKRVKEAKFGSFSKYVQQLVAEDLKRPAYLLEITRVPIHQDLHPENKVIYQPGEEGLKAAEGEPSPKRA